MYEKGSKTDDKIKNCSGLPKVERLKDFESLVHTVRNNFRCGIGKNRCGIGIFPLRAFPIPHRKLFLTMHADFKKNIFIKIYRKRSKAQTPAATHVYILTFHKKKFQKENLIKFW